MSNGTDQQMCCAAGVCCGGGDEITALSERLQNHDSTLTVEQADKAAQYIHGHFTLLPTSFGFGPVIRKIQEHPYE
jgi:hypothetical protein